MTNAATLRRADVADHAALESLQSRASLNNPGDRGALLQHPDAIEVALADILAGHVFLAERDGTIVGFGTVLPRDDGQAELDALFVEPALWRQGLGRLLLEHGAALARLRGAAALHVVANTHAEAFYRSSGFEATGTFKTRFGSGLLMLRTLAPG